MTQLTIINNKTMSSREISKLVESRHVDVCRTIERLTEKCVIKGSTPTAYTHEQNGQQYNEYHLSKRDSLIVVAQLCPEFTARIVDRWQELEAHAANPVLTLSRIDLLKMALDSEEQRLKLEGQVQVLTPKAEALDRITLSDGSMCLTNAAKVLGVQPKKFFAWMQEHQWIYRRAGGAGFTGYQARIQVGYLDHKVTTVSRSDGSDKTVEQVLVTSKGLAKLAGLMQVAEAA